MNMKNGNTRSVGVNPFHSAWRKGAYIEPHEPGLLTRIIPAMVIPRNMSSDKSLLDCCLTVMTTYLFPWFRTFIYKIYYRLIRYA